MVKKVLTFYLKDRLFGIPIDGVKEVSRRVEYSEVPGAKDYIVGLLNLRGQIVTLLDLSVLLGEEKKETENNTSACVILKECKEREEQIGFLIDKAGEVRDVEEDAWEEPPANLEEEEIPYIEMVAKLNNELLLLLRLQQIYGQEK